MTETLIVAQPMSNGHQTFCAVVNETLLLSWLWAKPWLCVNSDGHLEHSLGKSFSPSDPQNCCTANKHKVLHCHHTAAAGAAAPSPHTGKHKPVQLHLHPWTNRLPEPSSERYLVFVFFFFSCERDANEINFLFSLHCGSKQRMTLNDVGAVEVPFC